MWLEALGIAGGIMFAAIYLPGFIKAVYNDLRK
jgi:hypothetical protein